MTQEQNAFYNCPRRRGITPKLQPTESADDLASRGLILFVEDKYAEAISVLERATNIDPSIYAAWVTLGRAYYELGQYWDSLHAIDRALALDNKQAWALDMKRMVLNRLQRLPPHER